MADRQQVDISTTSVFKALLLVLFFVLLYQLSDVLVIILFAIVIASAVQPFVTWFEKRRVPRLVAVLLLYLLIFALGVMLSSLVAPSISADLSSFSTYLPKVTQQISTSLDTVQQGSSKYFDFVGELQNILDVITSYLQQFSQSAFSLLVGAFGGLFSFVAIIIISFYLSITKNGIQNFLASVIPERYEEYVVSLWQRVEVKVGYWLQGQLLLALVMGFLVFVGMSLLHVKFALLLGVIAMLLEIVPIAGPVLAAIPAIIIGFLQGPPTMGLWVALFYLCAQQFENHVLVPLILGKTTGMNPVVVIIAILVGSQLAGIVGALLAVPVATILVEILDDMARLKTSRRAAA